MKVIGLTGGIGSGKSVVSGFLAEMGVGVIDTDQVGHEVLNDVATQEKIVEAFGVDVLSSDNRIDRMKLGQAVFGNAGALAKLNQIMHPLIYKAVRDRLEKYRQTGTDVVIIEVPLLIEAEWISLVDKVWVTVAPEETIIRRVQQRTGMSEEEVRLRIDSQLSAAERARFADEIIDTDCSLTELKRRVHDLLQRTKTVPE
jgi:dephospho-CoA kinase